MTRSFLLLAFALALALPATAQNTGPTSEPDTVGVAAQERIAAATSDFHVITVRRDGGRFVYDVDGFDEDVIAFPESGFLVVRAPDLGRVLFVLEPETTDGRYPTTAALTQAAPAALIRSYLTRFDGPGRRVRALVCASGSGDDCTTWTEAQPLSGGDGLRVHVVPTRYSSPTGGNKGRDDG